MTDDSSSTPQETQAQADLARTEGVQLITIGIGNNANLQELGNIVNNPRKLYRTSSFSNLGRYMPEIRRLICDGLYLTDTKSLQ